MSNRVKRFIFDNTLKIQYLPVASSPVANISSISKIFFLRSHPISLQMQLHAAVSAAWSKSGPLRLLSLHVCAPVHPCAGPELYSGASSLIYRFLGGFIFTH